MQLRPYQQEFIDNIRKSLSNGNKHIVCQSPTGSGKSLCMAYITKNTIDKGGTVLILTHRQEIFNQNSETMEDLGLAPSFINAKTRDIEQSNLYIAMTVSFKNRVKKEKWETVWNNITMVIIDEAHLSNFDYIFDLPGIENKYVLSFTATPKRTGNQRSLDTMYTDIVFGKDVQELINLGFLVPDKLYSIPVDLSKVGISKGEYDEEQMYDIYDTPELYAGVVDNWKRICPDTITIVFCVNIQHCINTCKAFSDAGIQSKFITSGIAKPKQDGIDEVSLTKYNRELQRYNDYIDNFTKYSGERREVFEQWKRGDFKVLINAGIATTGFDYKPIETVIMNRATMSDNLLLQCLGRASRISPNKEYFNILDFGENCKRLGYYRQQREYTLEKKVGESSGDGIAASKECPKCHALLLSSMRYCKYCGYEFPKTRKEEIVDLVEIPYKEAIEQLSDVEELEIYQEAKGYKKQWLFRTIYFKYGKEGLFDYAKEHGYKKSWVFEVMARCNASH